MAKNLRNLSNYSKYSYGYRDKKLNIKLTPAERELVDKLCDLWGVNISDLFRGLLISATEDAGIE